MLDVGPEGTEGWPPASRQGQPVAVLAAVPSVIPDATQSDGGTPQGPEPDLHGASHVQPIDMGDTDHWSLRATSNPDLQAWLDGLLESDQSLDDLLADGCIGFSLKQLLPFLMDEFMLSLFMVGDWIMSDPAEDGDVAVMTDSIEMFEIVLRAMKDRGCSIPWVHAPDDNTLPIDSLPLQRPTAYNLPDGVRSHEVMDHEFLGLLQQMFADVKQIYGEGAHLYRLDYGAFRQCTGAHDTMHLAGEFVDLRDRAIYEFVMDGIPRRLRFSETGRYHETRAELHQGSCCERCARRSPEVP